MDGSGMSGARMTLAARITARPCLNLADAERDPADAGMECETQAAPQRQSIPQNTMLAGLLAGTRSHSQGTAP